MTIKPTKMETRELKVMMPASAWCGYEHYLERHFTITDMEVTQDYRGQPHVKIVLGSIELVTPHPTTRKTDQ
jgi:hypothetical protein